MGAFEYRQAEEIRDCFQQHGVRYLFIGKTGAILLGYPDTTQDADLFIEKTPENCALVADALRELGFALDEDQDAEIRRGKDFIQLKNGPFDLGCCRAEARGSCESNFCRRGSRCDSVCRRTPHKRRISHQPAN